MASQTGAHSVPGEDRMYSTPSLRNASTMAEPPSNWFFIFGLRERFLSCVLFDASMRKTLVDIYCEQRARAFLATGSATVRLNADRVIRCFPAVTVSG